MTTIVDATGHVDQSQHTSRSGKCTLHLEKCRVRFQKSSERSHERWSPYTFRTNYSANTQTFVLETILTNSVKNYLEGWSFLNGGRPYYETINWEIKFCHLFSYNVPSHRCQNHQNNTFKSKRHLIQRSQRDLYEKPTLIPYIRVPEQSFLVTYHTLLSLYVVFSWSTLWLQKRLLVLR